MSLRFSREATLVERLVLPYHDPRAMGYNADCAYYLKRLSPHSNLGWSHWELWFRYQVRLFNRPVTPAVCYYVSAFEGFGRPLDMAVTCLEYAIERGYTTLLHAQRYAADCRAGRYIVNDPFDQE